MWEGSATERLPGSAGAGRAEIPVIEVAGEAAEVLTGNARDALERVLPEFLSLHAWFGGATHSALGARLLDAVAVAGVDRPDYIVPTRVTFRLVVLPEVGTAE